MNLSVTQAFSQLEAFHRANGTCMEYQPQKVISRSRGGAVVTQKAISTQEISVIMDLNPTMEKITAFGDPSEFSAGQKAIFRVLACDLFPKKKDAFVWGGITYSILAIKPLQRGGQSFKFDVLVGYE